MSEKAALRVTVHGRVQGVFYRDWTVETARTLGLAGWVRNEADGTVAALLEGELGALDQMVERMRRGPPAAQVERTEQQPCPPEGIVGFKQR